MTASATTRAAGAGLALLEALAASLAAAASGPAGWGAAAAILWPDPEKLWLPLKRELLAALPELYILGSYEPAARTGPAIWLRCVVAGAIPEFALPVGKTPILYLPGVAQQDLRAGDHCPWAWQPLIELQYRGCVWRQRKSGREWTPDLFLAHELDLEIARDEATREALQRALPLLAARDLAPFRGRRLGADDFNALHVPDPNRDLLRWLGNPAEFRGELDDNAWQAFANVCRERFGFDPGDGPERAGEMLAGGGGAWGEVWRRYTEAPRYFPGVAQALRELRPRPGSGQATLQFDRSRNPAANERAEAELRAALGAAAGLAPAAARERIVVLETEHGERRDWVWAELGWAPLARALAPLARLATASGKAVGGATLAEAITAYSDNGWGSDLAAWQALAAPQGGGDRALVAAAVRALHGDWLDAGARRFQELLTGTGEADLRRLMPPIPADAETCVLFADGLRLDLGRSLQAKLEGRGLGVRFATRLAPIPTVTATAKPAVAPLPVATIGGGDESGNFLALVIASGQAATAPVLRAELEDRGVQIVGDGRLEYPNGAKFGGWAESGRIDERGHALGAELAFQLEAEVERLAERVTTLLDCGWRRVRVVTDHGWLLLPGGLPKIELPKYLAETRWARCAQLRAGLQPDAAADLPQFPWRWNARITIACPPGAGAFFANTEYAHGGVSPQECVVPEMLVERAAPAANAKIVSVRWTRLRCRVQVETNVAGARADLRTNLRQPESSIAQAAKELDASGQASLVVKDDSYEGSAAVVVIFDQAGAVLEHQATTVPSRSGETR